MVSAIEELAEISGLVWGVELQGTLPESFRPYLRPVPSTGAARRTLAVGYRRVPSLEAVEKIWSSPELPQAGLRLSLSRDSGGFGLWVEESGGGRFRCREERVEIEWLPGPAEAAHYFFAYALPLWLESIGFPVLHASAVALHGRAIAFVGQSGSGKSTLAAGLVRHGCVLFADDGLPVYEGDDGAWRCLAGPPLLKLWPSALEGWLEVAAASLPRVRRGLDKRLMPGSVEAAPADLDDLELAAVYLLERRPQRTGRVEVSRVELRESLVHLLAHGLAGAAVEALGLSAQRLEQLARVAERTPVRRLSYPSGGEAWPRVRDAIARRL